VSHPRLRGGCAGWFPLFVKRAVSCLEAESGKGLGKHPGQLLDGSGVGSDAVLVKLDSQLFESCLERLQLF
jgi:hypothetical protein